MQFADCRKRDDGAQWWQKAILPSGMVDEKELLKYTTMEDVEDFRYLLAKVKSRMRCVACGQYFRFGDTLGRWQCKSPVTGRKQDHYLPSKDTLDTRPPDIIISGWQYLALVYAGIIPCEHDASCEAQYNAVYDPDSGQLTQMCIKRHSV